MTKQEDFNRLRYKILQLILSIESCALIYMALKYGFHRGFPKWPTLPMIILITCCAVFFFIIIYKPSFLTLRVNSTPRSQAPPISATILLCIFLSHTDRDSSLGDLDEKFPKWVERHGLRMARFIYFRDACTMIYPAALKLLAKIGAISGLGEIIRRWHW
jgi:hypothetical protein